MAPSGSGPTAPEAVTGIAAEVDRRMITLLDAEIVRWAGVDPDLGVPLTALRDLVEAGGKRLRPAFCHWAFVGAGGDPGDPLVVDAGAALELLHTFALIHDDVMDGSARRRGRDTIHLAFEARHASAGWRGEGRRFGEGVAILVGDLAFVYADILMADAPRVALDVFAELRLEVNVGQYLDLLNTVRGDTPRHRARRIAHYKSGKYSVERPLHLGAALAGRLEELGGDLSAYGTPLGEAFQLRDDLLGSFGDSALTGKPVGQDLREGKPTLLHAVAGERAAGEAARVLAGFGRPDLTDDEVVAMQEVLEVTGARREVERVVDGLVAEAIAALDRLRVTADARLALAELADYVVERAL